MSRRKAKRLAGAKARHHMPNKWRSALFCVQWLTLKEIWNRYE